MEREALNSLKILYLKQINTDSYETNLLMFGKILETSISKNVCSIDEI